MFSTRSNSSTKLSLLTNTENHLERISQSKVFINNYNWEKVSFPSHKNDWNKFETSNKSNAFNDLLS